MIEKIRYELLPHNCPLNEKRLPIVVWAVSATLADTAGNFETQARSLAMRPLGLLAS